MSMLEELLFGGSPKYVAHQFALLYRALASTGLALQSFKIKVLIKKTFLFFCRYNLTLMLVFEMTLHSKIGMTNM